MSNAANVFTKRNLQQAFETVAQINEELKRRESYGAFCKKSKLLIDIFHFLWR